MSLMRIVSALFVTSAMTFGIANRATADEGKLKNLKVIQPGKEVEAGMKAFSKGLGVKCNACHVKGKFEADDVPEKESTRKFLTAVVGEKDSAKRDAELKTLLEALKLKEAKDSAEVWKAIDTFKKK